MTRSTLTIAALAVVGILALVVLSRREHKEVPPQPATATSPAAPESPATSTSPTSNNASELPGLQTSEAPWAPQISHLEERLQAIGLPALRREGTTLHLHQHLDLFIHGQPVPVPPMIGINLVSGFISPVHTHDGTGAIHIESAVVARYTLGQFFDVWGLRFTPTCLGGYCNSGEQTLRVYVNGSPVDSNPREIELKDDQEIVIAYGTEEELPNPIPSTFKAPS